MVNTPIPQNLKSETKKAAKILREFTMPNSKIGPDKLIPAGILAKAKGLAIITVFKAGFLVTARGGSGIVIAKLDDDNIDYATGWSAPSAIGLAGLGGGFEIGAEVTDFVIILNTRAAISAFSKGGNLTLGGNFTVAAGPIGRNIEGDVSVRSPAAIYTYSKTKGLFAGISIEGSALIERKDANKKFYGRHLRASQILCGDVDPPDECKVLYEVMRDHQNMAAEAALQMAKQQAHRKASGLLSGWRSQSKKSSLKSSSRSKSEWFLSRRHHSDDEDEPERGSDQSKYQQRQQQNKPTFVASAKPGSTARSELKKRTAKSTLALNTDDDSLDRDVDFSLRSSARVASMSASPSWVVADYTFDGQLSCDLPFKAGERLKVTTSTGSRNDWWEGLNERGRQGIFPANYVHVVG